MARGVFITLEGGEGVGKSTLSSALATALRERGKTIFETREPGGSPGAEALRDILLKPPVGVVWSPIAQTLLFNAARRNHIETLIEPALVRGDWVICDRYIDSTRAYQAAAGGLDADKVRMIEEIVAGQNRPELTLILDLPIKAAEARRKARAGATDPFEAAGADFHERVRAAFLKIADEEAERCVVLDASKPPEHVLKTALKTIDALWPPTSPA